MSAVSPKMVSKMLRKAADDIENNRCGMDDDELRSFASMLGHRKLNIEQTCNLFGISRATLNRWQECGKLPEFRKDSGGKCYLYEDEALESVEKYNNEK